MSDPASDNAHSARPMRPKETSYAYGDRSQQKMLEKYRNRANNHWKRRIELAQQLVAEHITPRHPNRAPKDIVVVDVGCSIGTFALEFARLGYCCYGVDFDPAAITIGRALAQEENSVVEFLEMDVADWSERGLPPVDIAICFDIFEHLHDDEIGALLQALKRSMPPEGRMVFSTTPTQYSYLWVGGSFKLALLRRATLAFTWLRPSMFRRYVRALAALMDVVYLLQRGGDHRELIKREKHCNPLSRERLEGIFARAGFRFDYVATTNLHPDQNPLYKRLDRHPILHSHIYGVAHVVPV